MKHPFDIKRIVIFTFYLQARWDFVSFIKLADGSWRGEYEGDTWNADEYEFTVEYCVLSDSEADSDNR